MANCSEDPGGGERLCEKIAIHPMQEVLEKQWEEFTQPESGAYAELKGESTKTRIQKEDIINLQHMGFFICDHAYTAASDFVGVSFSSPSRTDPRSRPRSCCLQEEKKPVQPKKEKRKPKA
ncbi:hypothetical protein PRIPAC_91998 [Pristionchus pacificus]|uniref:Uncharacterized protein n=1 Tax=Pristionchus pacificus TaxID=54126 RepID=A0A2A6CD22_PRIPA|nr:hypothetical protein PRIPAC_91998 [Pristionchus pacificus]|eukprot:PDM76094.1 hypothetical protein PRIPAC_39698 [Pristionchus pacificus]